jgi:RNA polymerase sigma factor (sigma-70 family)
MIAMYETLHSAVFGKTRAVILMTKRWEDNFDALLAWLDPGRDRAGEKYEDIRHSLVNIFSWRGCYDAEDLADETITRVTNKLPEVAQGYKGDPALYFYGVAKNLLWEVTRREQSKVPSVTIDEMTDAVSDAPSNDFEREYDCLEQCLQELSADDRELALLYYQQEQPKIDYRKAMARRLGVAPNNLRVKVHRIRAVLHSCIEKCLENKAEDETN